VPNSPLESAIAQIWSDVLQVGEVTVNEDFFELGGDSLQAVRMLATVEDVLGSPVSFTDFIEAPTVAQLARELDRVDRAPRPPQAPVEHVENGRAPCSFGQERLWFVEQLTGGKAVYNLPLARRLRGKIDEDALERSLQTIVGRHAALRTSFEAEDGRPQQVVARHVVLTLDRRDLRLEDDPESEAQRLTDEAASVPFDLERPPLARASLFRVADEDYVLLLVFHHIVCDGWSHVVVFEELGALYRAEATGEASELPQPRIQYDAYASHQQADPDSEALEEKVAHWTERLEGMPMALDLATDRPRPAVPSYEGATHRTPLSHADAIRAFSRSAGATPFATLLSVFDLLLFRYTGQETIAVGATTSGRGRSELDDAVGLFANTVVLRSDLRDDLTFTEFVRKTRDVVLDALAYQDAPFERLVAELQPDRDQARHPIFQVFFAQVPDAPLDLPGVEPYAVSPSTARFDLTLWVEEQGEEIELVWEYATDLFHPSTIERFERHFLQLLESALTDPEQRLGAIPMIGDIERRELIERWAGDGFEYPVECLHRLFEAHAARAPDRPAVTCEGATITYGALNEQANRLARYLRTLGVGDETLVALCFERSIEMVVAILAVLKAGGAYVPLDPDYPLERLAFVVEDTRAPVILTQQPLLDRLSVGDAAIVCLDSDEPRYANERADDLEPLATPASLAYVIYTSGSTGKPKGVQVEHRNVARLFTATDEWFGFDDSDTWLLFHSYAFDFSVWELWGALLYGGRLAIAPRWTTRSPQALATLLAEEQVTVFNATPSLFVSALDELLLARAELALRYVVFGGEALQPTALAPWYAKMAEDAPLLVNMYGITETTVHVTYRPLRAEDAHDNASPIGGPIPDLQIQLLDANLEPVPVGVAGELFVGGPGVARGYLNRSELTAERFLANPFGTGRLYRSGDLARARANGSLEFLGRIDDQVKVRGFRIELGEVQAVLNEHDGIAESAVVAFEAAPGDTRLAAFVVPAGAEAAPAKAEALRTSVWSFLEERLPGFMVPASLTVLENLPLTQNGKINRKALPVPTWEREDREAFVAPRSDTERVIAEIWQDILAVEEVGVHDNFFNLGGHSLLAARVLTQARKRLDVKLSVSALFEHPTVASLASTVDSLRVDTPEIADVAPQPASAEDNAAYPLSFTQQQLHFFQDLAPGAAVYNAALAARISGPIDHESLEQAIRAVIDRHEPLRTVFRFGEEGSEQVVLSDWSFALEIAELDEVDLSRRLREAAHEPFDLSRDLMLRATLFELGNDEHVLFFGTHHVVFDAWSVDIFFREISELYNANLVGRPPSLPELPLQYRDFAVWQRDRLRGEKLDAEREYWRQALAGAPTVLTLPADRPRPTTQTFDGATHSFELPEEVVSKIEALCRSQQVTPYMLLLAAFATLIYRRTGADDILFGGPNANRARAEFEHLIGFFANTLVLRVRLGGNPSFTELLTRVRQTALETYDHEELPFDRIVDAVRPRRDPGVNPLFQVNFRVRAGRLPTLELDGAKTVPLRIETGLARFDLALELHVVEGAIGAELGYNTQLFDAATIERLARELMMLLQDAVTRPETSLLALELADGEHDGPNANGAALGIRRFRDRVRPGGAGQT
jgi:amino acid adenylation domain-containing protein